MSRIGGQTIDLSGFQYKFMLSVKPGHYLHIMMGILKNILKNFFFVFMRSEYSTKLYQLMSINGGQSLHLSSFQHKFILHVMPGH